METLNYHHLRLFQAVAREGHLTRASSRLHLTPQTVSSQIRDLEATIGEQLFRRSGRRLHLTDAGQVALRYTDEIFSLGQELLGTLRGQPSGRPFRVRVGAPEALPKLIVHRPTREEAIAVARRALDEFVIYPTKTTIPLCREILSHDKFVSGQWDTTLIEREMMGA